MKTAIIRDKLQLPTNMGIWLPIILVEICLAAIGTLFPIKPMIIILIGFPLVVYLFLKPFHAYLFTIFMIPFWIVTLSGVEDVHQQADIRYTQIAALIAALSWLFNGLVTKKLYFEKNVLFLPMAILVGWMLLSFIWGTNVYFGVRDFVRILYGAIIFFLTINIVKDEKTLGITLKAWTIVGLLCALSGMIELLTTTLPAVENVELSKNIKIWGPTVRLSGLKENPHRLGFLLNVCLMITVTQLIITKSRKYKLFLIFCVFSILAVLTNVLSRSSWVGCITGIVCCSLYSKRFAKIFLIGGLVVFVLFVVLAPVSLQHVVTQRFLGILNPMETHSIAGRSSVWDAGVQMFKEHPFIGVGIGSFRVFAQQSGSASLAAPHDLYLFYLSTFGLIGFTIFLFLIFTFATSIIKGFKCISSKANKFVLFGLSVGLVIYLVQGLVVNFKFIEMEIWALLGLAMAALKVFMSQEEKIKGGLTP